MKGQPDQLASRRMAGLLPFTLHRSLFTASLVLAVQSVPPPRYLPAHLTCAVFRETVTGEVRGEGRDAPPERVGREGVLVVRVVDPAADTQGLRLEAWYDSLTVWREGREGRAVPDPEGLLGGRWIGRLQASGGWTREQVPFVPDEVGAVFDLGPLMDDWLPRLPARALRVGQADSTTGRVIRRQRDAGGARRFSWLIESRTDTLLRGRDSVEIPIRRATREEGTLVWDSGQGPLAWERTITTTLLRRAAGAWQATGTGVQQVRVTREVPDRACGG